MTRPVETFGERVRRHRRAAGLSGETLAMRLGVSNVCISHWENNNRTPRPWLLKALARALGVSPAYLETGEHDQLDLLIRAIRAGASNSTLLAMVREQERP